MNSRPSNRSRYSGRRAQRRPQQPASLPVEALAYGRQTTDREMASGQQIEAFC